MTGRYSDESRRETGNTRHRFVRCYVRKPATATVPKTPPGNDWSFRLFRPDGPPTVLLFFEPPQRRSPPASQTDKRAVNTIHAILRDRFPRAFPKDYDAIHPLKIGILADAIARMPGFDPVVLRRALANHTSRNGYLLTLIHGRGDRRYDLDGQPAGAVTPEERAEAMRKLEASTKRGQDQAERVRTHKEREERCCQQREIERHNREAKAARKAEHERIQQEIAARKAALIAQGITPESRSEHKRRLARAATEHAARKTQGPRPVPDRPAVQGFPRPEPTPAKPMPQVAFKKKRRFVPPDEK